MLVQDPYSPQPLAVQPPVVEQRQQESQSLDADFPRRISAPEYELETWHELVPQSRNYRQLFPSVGVPISSKRKRLKLFSKGSGLPCGSSGAGGGREISASGKRRPSWSIWTNRTRWQETTGLAKLSISMRGRELWDWITVAIGR